jgi:hypothetical protein
MASRACRGTSRQASTFPRSELWVNAGLNVTGVLVYSDLNFGQIIEDPAQSLMALRSSILSDARHTEVKTIADGKAADRRFGRWALAYSGTSMVVSRALQRTIRDSARDTEGAGSQLLQLMEEMLYP